MGRQGTGVVAGDAGLGEAEEHLFDHAGRGAGLDPRIEFGVGGGMLVDVDQGWFHARRDTGFRAI